MTSRSELLTSNNADVATRKTVDSAGHAMGVGGTVVVERLEPDPSGSLLSNWVVVSERTIDENGSHSWSLLSGLPSDAPWLPNDLYRFEGSSFSTDLLGDTPTTPEASTWVMMLIGFAGLGIAGYRSSENSLSPDPISQEGHFAMITNLRQQRSARTSPMQASVRTRPGSVPGIRDAAVESASDRKRRIDP